MKIIFKRSLSFFMSALLICSMAFSLQIKTVVAEEADSTDEVSFYENLSEAEFSEDDTITVLIEFDYPENDYDIRETDSLESSQEQLRLLRASNKAYYTENNQEFIDDLDIEYDDMDVSAYSPYVFITFETWDEYADARDDLIELSEDDKVKKVFAEETPVKEETIISENISSSSSDFTLDEAMKLVGVKNENGSNVTNFTGEGIRVGILDKGYPDSYVNFSNGEINGLHGPSIVSDHTTYVASIIGGTHGVAPEAELYISGDDIREGIEWMISEEINVNVINISLKFEPSMGHYVGLDAYVDYIAYSNYVLIVKSSGNHDDNDTTADIYVSTPGMGLNVIAVGSVNSDRTLSEGSNYVTLDGFSNKPTLVAPGWNLTVPNVGTTSGTSLSAPIVTGIIALLLDEFEDYIYYPDLIVSALINGCEWISGQNSIWDESAGAGLVNYANARETLLNERYETASISTTSDNTTAIIEISTYLNATEDLTYCLFDYIKPNEYDIFSENSTVGWGESIQPNSTEYQVKVFNPAGSVIHTGTSNKNIAVGKVVSVPTNGTYYIRVYMNSTKNSDAMEYLSLTYSATHVHSHTHHYTQFNRVGHKSYCYCGQNVIEPHVYEPYYGGQICVICGYTN